MAEDSEQLQSLLADYVEGQLDAESSRVVEAHLVANPATRALVDQMKVDREAVRGLPRLNVPADLSEDLRGRLERDQLLNDGPIGASHGRRLTTPVAAIAALLMAGLGLAGVAYVLLANRPTPYFDVAIRDELKQSKDGAAAGDEKIATTQAAPGELAMKEGAATELAPPKLRSIESTAVASNAARVNASPSDRFTAGAALPGAASGGTDTAANSARDAFGIAEPIGSGKDSVVSVAKAMPERTAGPTSDLEVASGSPPGDVALALENQKLDPARRSVAIVVDQRDVLDALASANRAARVAGSDVEIVDGAAMLAMSNANALDAARPAAGVAAIARGLSPSVAADVQQELSRLHPDESTTLAFDVSSAITPTTQPTLSVGSEVAETPQRSQQLDPYPQQAASQVTSQVASQADQSSALVPSGRRDANAAQDRRGSAASSAPVPATQPADAGLIRHGDRLRITLTDPDAFDLRTQHEVVVDAQGNIALPSLDHVPAAGESADTLKSSIVNAYRQANLMRRPIVRVEPVGIPATATLEKAKSVDLYVIVRAPAMPSTAPTSRPASLPTTRPG